MFRFLPGALLLGFAVTAGVTTPGCTKTAACKKGTLFLHLTLDATAMTASSSDVSVAVEGSATLQGNFTPTTEAGTGTLEVDFGAGYPSGKTVSITVAALGATQTTIAAGTANDVTLSAGCESVDIDVTAGGADMNGNADLGNDDGGTCPVLYVSPGGVDTNDGCSSSAPVRTIAHALALKTGPLQEVHVCAGSYPETNLTLRGIVKGQYKCADWSRSSQNGVMVTNGSYAMSTVTATIPADAPLDTLVDGITFNGANAGTNGGTALLALGPAVISNNNIFGGSTSSVTGTAGSVGLEADGPEDVNNNVISGGTGGASMEAGSIGLVVFAPATATRAPHIHDNMIGGGAGNGRGMTYGSLGAWLTGALPLTQAAGTAFENNTVNGGTGQTTATGYPASMAVATGGGAPGLGNIAVDVVSNQIDGGRPVSGGGVAVFAGAGGVNRILANRIYAGDQADNANGRGVVGVSLANVVNPVVANNMILGGSATSGEWSVDIEFDVATSPIVAHNTLIAGSASGGGYTPLINMTSATGAIIQNNILGGSGNAGTYGVVNPSLSSLMSFEANVTFNGDVYYDYPSTDYTNDQTLEAAVPAASANVRLAQSCASDTGCIAQAACDPGNPSNCLAYLFGAWDTATNGKSNLFSATAWPLVANDPCAVTKSSLADIANYPTDLFNTVRTSPPSMGAFEFDGVCQ